MNDGDVKRDDLSDDDSIEEDFEDENWHPFQQFVDGDEQWSPSTQEVLSWFGRERRGAAVIRRINSDLEDFGLEMSPPIDEADYYGEVSIMPAFSSVKESVGDLEPNLREGVAVDGDASDDRATGWIISSLKPDAGTLDFLTYGQTVDDAVDKMKTRGRSKLPLFFDERDRSSLIGTVTLSDLTMDSATSDSKLIDLAQTKVPVLPTSDSLMDWIPVILQHGFVYGKSADGSIVQIYTVSDVAHHLNTLAQMFLRANELEDLIRGFLSRFPSDEVAAARGSVNSLTSIPLDPNGTKYLSQDELNAGSGADEHVSEGYMFSDYMKCFGDQDFWGSRVAGQPSFGGLDKEMCIRSLNDARIARNKVMHISSQEILDTLIPSFEAAAVWLRKLAK